MNARYNMASALFSGPTKEQAQQIDRQIAASLEQYNAAVAARVPGSCYRTNEDGTCNAWDCKLHGEASLASAK